MTTDADKVSQVQQAIDVARVESAKRDGRCSMCAVGSQPYNGFHRGEHACGNALTCSLCHGCLPVGEQCQACFRIQREWNVP